MRSGPVDPTRGPGAIGPLDGLIGSIQWNPITPGGTSHDGSNSPTPEFETFDRVEIHVDGVVRRAYAQFQTHPETGIVSIKIIDAETREIIREIPSEQVIKMAEELQTYWDARKRPRTD